MSGQRDDHGQPLERAFNARMVAARTIDEMLGLCKGILADGQVVEAEARFLRHWLRQNRDVAGEWPASVLAERLQRIFADGRVSLEEAEDLRELLAAITGEGAKPDDPTSGARHTTALPLDDPPPEIIIPGRRFCFTGRFTYGTPTLKTDYLVLGVLGSRDWVHTTHGRKIEFAMDVRDNRGRPLAIIGEESWVRALHERRSP